MLRNRLANVIAPAIANAMANPIANGSQTDRTSTGTSTGTVLFGYVPALCSKTFACKQQSVARETDACRSAARGGAR